MPDPSKDIYARTLILTTMSTGITSSLTMHAIPWVEHKARSALRWISDECSTFAERRVAFAAVHVIFFFVYHLPNPPLAKRWVVFITLSRRLSPLLQAAETVITFPSDSPSNFNDNVRHVLADFAVSEGIVVENLVKRPLE